MKSVLRSIKPYWLYLILIGKKSVEVGKDCPKSRDWNRVVELYCSRDKKSFNRIPEKDKEWMQKLLGKVVCRFVCDFIEIIDVYKTDEGYDTPDCVSEYMLRDACLTLSQAYDYANGQRLYGWHISDLVIYDEPKELSEFKQCHRCPHVCVPESQSLCKYHRLQRPPQSWCYCAPLQPALSSRRIL